MSLLLRPFRWPDDLSAAQAFLAHVPGPTPLGVELSLEDALLHGTDPGAIALERGRVLGLLFRTPNGLVGRIHPSLESSDLASDLVATLESEEAGAVLARTGWRTGTDQRSLEPIHQQRFSHGLRRTVYDHPVAALLALTAFQAAVALAVVSLGPVLPLGSELAQRLATTLVSAIAAALLLHLLGLWREAGFVRPSAWQAPLAGLAVTFLGLAPLLTGLAPLPPVELGALVAGMAVNSFAEEAVFRGLALALLLPLGPWRAVLWTSLAFGLLHVIRLLFGAELAPTLIQMAFATNFGLLMGALRLQTGTIWWPILAHTVVNVSGSLALEDNGTWGLAVFLGWQAATLGLALLLMHPSGRSRTRTPHALPN